MQGNTFSYLPCSPTATEAQMKQYKLRKLQTHRHFTCDRYLIGIDPAKASHQAQILSPDGLPTGSTFSFKHSFSGFHHQLWKRLSARLPELAHRPRHELSEHLVFAVEASCNLWANLVDYLHHQGCRVVLVSPLSTCHARPSKSGDFSRTDPKDAYLVADLARDGRFHFHRLYSPEAEAMHRLAITYDKLRKNLQQNYARLRALLELVFPELLKILTLDSLTAHHLLGRYLFPEDFLKLDLDTETACLMEVSHNQHGRETLVKLQIRAQHTIGVAMTDAQQRAHRLSARAWLCLIKTIKAEINHVSTELIVLSKKTPYHAPLLSLKGISDLLAALFIAELRDPGQVKHIKQIERLAGLNLYVHDSGTYKGRRRISHIGNARLRWVLFTMASETSKYVPEIRCKYLRRRLKGQTNRNKNLVAAIPHLLALVMTLIREGRPYEHRRDTLKEMHRLEAELEDKKRLKRPGQARRAKQAVA